MSAVKNERIIEEEISINREEVVEPRKRNYKKLAFYLIFAISLAGNLYSWNTLRVLKQDPAEANQKDIKETVDKVSKLMVLPTDETPTLATVSDPDKLRGQAFFANAKVGDKVLVYQKAQKAILYNPSSGRIVEVAPIGASTAPTTAPVVEAVKKK